MPIHISCLLRRLLFSSVYTGANNSKQNASLCSKCVSRRMYGCGWRRLITQMSTHTQTHTHTASKLTAEISCWLSADFCSKQSFIFRRVFSAFLLPPLRDNICVCVFRFVFFSHVCVSICAVLDPWVTATTAVLSRLENWVGLGG